jgi:catechol 2,3-dioxygenase-like lactoylglutathione lyase family enzyme
VTDTPWQQNIAGALYLLASVNLFVTQTGGWKMIEVAGIDHLVLRTTKLNQMLDFYIRVLGCRVERQSSPETGLTQLRAGFSLIDIVAVESRLGRLGGAAPAAEGNNLDHFCLQIKSIPEDELVKHLEGFGIEVGEFAERYGAQGLGRSIYIKDPEGNTVELRNRMASPSA